MNKDTNYLPMSIGDIAKAYKEAKDKKKQVEILADLNDCTKETIIQALQAGGITAQQLPRGKETWAKPEPMGEVLKAPQGLTFHITVQAGATLTINIGGTT